MNQLKSFNSAVVSVMSGYKNFWKWPSHLATYSTQQQAVKSSKTNNDCLKNSLKK